MELWTFRDYRTDDSPPKNLIQEWYGRQDISVQVEFDATVKILAKTEEWRKAKEFKVLNRQHAGLGELRFCVRDRKHGKEIKRRFRPVGIWNEHLRDFTFLIGCEKSREIYTPPDAFNLALEYKSRLEQGKGSTREHC